MKPPGKRSTVHGGGKRRPVIAHYNKKGADRHNRKAADRGLRWESLVVGQQFIVPKNREQRTNVTDVMAPDNG
jgi:hypothetical protein